MDLGRLSAAQRRIRALVELGKTEAALNALADVLAEEPNDPELLELLGLCQIRSGAIVDALATLRRAIENGPDCPHLYYLVGFAAREANDLLGAEQGFRDALIVAPDEPVYLRALAELLADTNRFDEALDHARRAVREGVDTPQNHVTLGYVASAAGQIELAAAEYRAALAIDPNCAVAWNNLGCLDMARGDRLAARERFHESLRLDPRSEHAQRNLANVRPAARPDAIYENFDAFVGEVVRELSSAQRLGEPLRMLAIAQAVGTPALRAALTTRVESSSAKARVAVAASAAAAAALVRSFGPASLMSLGLGALGVGVGYLATARRTTPLRRRLVAHIAAARRTWEAERAAWLDGRSTRATRDRAIDRALEKLAADIDREPLDDPPILAPEVAR